MITQRQPNAWSCTPTAFAMALDISVQEMFERVGHDGSELRHGFRRSFHIQECIAVCFDMGYTVTPLEFQPACTPDGGVTSWQYDQTDFVVEMLKRNRGVLTGLGAHSQKLHTAAWEPFMVHDPNGTSYELNDSENHILLHCFWSISRKQHQITL